MMLESNTCIGKVAVHYTVGCSFQVTGLAVSLVAIYGYKSLTNKGAEKLSIFERMASVESGH